MSPSLKRSMVHLLIPILPGPKFDPEFIPVNETTALSQLKKLGLRH